MTDQPRPSSKLKLYVWEYVLFGSSIFGDPGMMVALAEDVESARKMLQEKCSYLDKYDLAREPTVHEDPCAFYVWGGD